MRHPPSRSDINFLVHRAGAPQVGEPVDMDGYTRVSPYSGAGITTGIVVFHGQSNCANFVNTNYTPTQSNAHMLDPYSGAIYALQEPIVGCNGGLPGPLGNPTGNMTTRVVDKLRAAGWRQRVILANCAAGGTTSDQWAIGDCSDRIRVTARRLKSLNLTPTVIVRHQGESDQTSGYTASRVTSNIRAEKAIWVSEGILSPMIVCKVAYSSSGASSTPAYTAVRLGQTNAVSPLLGIYAGPDTDVYGSGYRQGDDLHWNATGADAVSTDIKNAIMSQVP